MNALFAKVQKALAHTSITPKTHPVLVALLQMAGQPVGPAPGAVAMRLSRDWQSVAAAVVACGMNGVTDADVLAALPLDGLSFDQRGWRVVSDQPLQYRSLVHRALLRVLALKSAVLQEFEINCIDDLREARRKNHLPEIEDGLGPVKLMTRLHPGRRICVASELYGTRCFSLLEADKCGRLIALTHETSERRAMRWNEKNPPRS